MFGGLLQTSPYDIGGCGEAKVNLHGLVGLLPSYRDAVDFRTSLRRRPLVEDLAQRRGLPTTPQPDNPDLI
jgi:hypothetical protein